MTYADAIAYLESLTNYEQVHQPDAMREVTLERLRLLCELLGHPERQFRSILVAGTNGKGSISAMIYEVLRQAGCRVGLYTSPHLEHLRERFRVSTDRARRSEEITQAEFASLVAQLRPPVEAVNRSTSGQRLTYFEVLTALAFLHFARRGVDLVVAEVGLGGRLDATNVLEPIVSVLAPIGLDHTDVLGTDIMAIAKEKAGILRPGRVVISAAQQPAVSWLFRELAAAQACRLIELGMEVTVEILQHTPEGLVVTIRSPRGAYEQVLVPLLGRHQAENAALAVAAVEVLSERGLPHSAVRKGLAEVRWPGRLEIISQRPIVVLDGAHNLAAAETLGRALTELWPGRARHLLIGMSKDKATDAVAAALGPLASSVTCVQSRHPRACDARQLAAQFAPHAAIIHIIPDAADAYTYLINTVPPEEMIVVTGSLFLVGELRGMTRQAHLMTRRARRRSMAQQEAHRCP